VTSAIAAARSAAQAGASSDQVGLQHSCKDIMAQGLLHLLQLNPSADGAAAAAAAAKAATSGRRLQRAISAAADGVYDLLAALESVQDCSSYLLSLVEMSKQASDSVQRRALKLLATRLQKCAVDIADLETAESAAGLSPAERAAAERELVEAGLAICPQLARLLQPSTPAITQQLALVAADAGIRQFGAHMPPVVLGSLMDVLQVVAQSGAPPAVRASALACIAAGVTALGHQLVPLLPQTAETVLGAAEAAVQGLAAAEQAGSDSSSDEEEGQATERDTSRAAEECALQLAGAVAALEALVTGLGAFMSPYIKRILQLLLSRQVLSCSVANANAAAGRLRGSLPAKIPARLLIEPLVSQWEHVLAACGKDGGESGPAVGLLDLVAGLASSLEPSVAVAYHEQLAGLLLQALDTRSRWLASSSGDGQQQQQLRTAAAAAGVDGSTAAAAAAAAAAFGAQEVHAIEAGAVRALSALVMKLSESKFKPLFLRMLDWTSAEAGAAGSGSSAGSEQQGIGRVAALFAAVVALGHRLRGVFAPYHKYFAMQLMKQLAGEGLGGGGGKRSKKKRKLSAAAADGSSGSSEHAQMSAWLARLRAVRAVHLLALHEAPGATPAAQQEAQERTGRMVPLLVEVLQEGPPPACAALLAEQGSDPALDVAGGPVAALGPVGKAVVEAGAGAVLESAVDVVGAAAVGALLAVAVAGGSDVVWKPLHHALLMSTRGGSVRAKLLALGAVSRLVAELREEYLMLLPEALPFIAELVEEGEVAVEAAAQGLIAQMEALSGERLEQYLKA
jgi:U3 small nucleolar RNA-associated protein 10